MNDQLNGNEINDASTGSGPRGDSGREAGNIRRGKFPLERKRWRPRARQNADPTDNSDNQDGEIYYIQYCLKREIAFYLKKNLED